MPSYNCWRDLVILWTLSLTALFAVGCSSRATPSIRPPPGFSSTTTPGGPTIEPTQPPTPTGPTTTPPPNVCPDGRPTDVTSDVVLFSDWPSMSAAGPRAFLTDHLPTFASGVNCLNVRVGDLVLSVTGNTLKNWIDGDVTRVSQSTSVGGGQDFQSLLRRLEDVGGSLWLNAVPNDNSWSTVCNGRPSIMECLFTFASTWNSHVGARMIVGIVIDGINISSSVLPDLVNQGAAAKGSLRLGLTVGLGVLNGAKNRYTTSIDVYFSFLLDFWVPSPEAYRGAGSEFATRKDQAQDMANFLLSSISGESPIPKTDTQRYADDTVLLWSPRHFGSPGCMYPLNNRACTDTLGANELGSWSPMAAIELMKDLKSKAGSDGTRLGFYTLSLMPFTWLTVDYRKCFGGNC
ncbi:hypothetical protein FOL47_003547 [Perkinsus chesapeaki]|uniref:Uncharacterized protein n=1 Tax=Perkinsus chesapeaki TaxID=330153 RepID=A0A7J6N050_PERCH|nr:hypothetical protein FOL47_003547 [Perkinsus chesapeaki]